MKYRDTCVDIYVYKNVCMISPQKISCPKK